MIKLEELDRDPWSTYPVNKDELRKLLYAMHFLIERIEYLESEVLTEVLGYFEDREDFEDGDHGVQEPNQEAYLADLIRKSIVVKTTKFEEPTQ